MDRTKLLAELKIADAARAMERERCAKIAIDQQYGDPLGPQEVAFNDACSRIHDAILNQEAARSAE